MMNETNEHEHAQPQRSGCVDPVTGYRCDQEIPEPICDMQQIGTATSEPPQEWTPEYLDELLDLKFERGPVAMSVSDYYVRLQSVSDNINATITADLDWREQAGKQLDEAHKELLSERETIEMLHRQRRAAERQRDSVIRQFSAERERSEHAMTGWKRADKALTIFHNEHEKTLKKLLAAQSANLRLVEAMEAILPRFAKDNKFSPLIKKAEAALAREKEQP